VLAQCKARHRHQEFLAFLRRIDTAVPVGFDVHLVVDNYATHKHPRVRAWLAKPPRFHVHYTPTYASWLNQVERWFAILTSREIRRGSLGSAKDLIARITAFVAAYNAHSRPFAWTATADDILAKIARVCNVISGTSH
jgi:putative transposase